MSSTPRKWKFRLRHMQEAVDRILGYTQPLSESQFRASRQVADAVIWNLTVLGEAAKYIRR
jgi:uncharacterized protein with HEPN domain